MLGMTYNSCRVNFFNPYVKDVRIARELIYFIELVTASLGSEERKEGLCTKKSNFPDDLRNCCMKLITSKVSSTKVSLFCAEKTAFAIPCLEIS